MRYPLTLALSLVASICWAQINPVEYVNPFVGTTNFGTTNPGAVSPNGMMSVVPFNVMGSADNVHDKDARWWSAPYEYHNSYFTGFSHVNLSGVGCPELGSLLLMPTTGDLEVDYRSYGSGYSDQEAKPGYYSLQLTKYGIKAEVTATKRSSVERYTFPAGSGNILLNLGEGLTNESGAMVRRVSDTEIEGVKLMGTFCYNQDAVFPIYFVMQLSKSPDKAGCWKRQPSRIGVEAQWDIYSGDYKLYENYNKQMAGDDIGFYFTFSDLAPSEQIEVRMGVSFVSTENARLNLEQEQGDRSFDEIYAETSTQWEEVLSRIIVEGGSQEQREVFYTALYHALLHPNLLNDVNGEYPAMESDKILRTKGDRYTVFSLWDTYRNLHQLLTLVYPERQTAMIQTMLDIYNEHGWLPKWELYGQETYTMSGDPATIVIVDSWMRGLQDFDAQVAYEAMLKSATTPSAYNPIRPEISIYEKLGYIPYGTYAADLSGDNSVSNALEYYLADNALSLFADSLGYHEDAKRFRERSLGYKNYYDKQFGTLRPKDKEGNFYEDFDPRAGENFEHAVGFHEGSAWNYTYFVPHDVQGLIKLMGGKRKFVEKLQMIFDQGLYDPANEPDIAYPYLFSRIEGEEWRTQKEVNRLLAEHYTSSPDGIPGNDDTGTMSAWAIFSMMGLYPDTPGDPSYTITSPQFDRVTIKHQAGDIVIEAHRDTSEDIYIESIQAGGESHNSYRISHEELLIHNIIDIKLKTP